MLYTNSEALRPEIMDVLRLFDCENENFTHYFSTTGEVFFNSIEYKGEFYDFEDTQKVEDDLELKRYAKRFCKLSFYKVLKKVTGMSLPWGALTGIRPTKLAYMEREAGRDFKQLFKAMDVSDPNISLVERILNTQKRVYIKGGTDVFISIPFCPTKCEYCSFITAPIGSTKGYVEDYLNCLVKEIESVAGKIHNLKSVYIGGGTPFVLEVDQLERVYSALSKAFPKIREYTVEAGRADVFTEEKLAQAKRWGVTRICVNPQSFNNKTLEAIGRKHTAEQTIEAYHMAEKYGFDINIDLIAGLADEGVEEFAYSVDKAIELNPANITVHTLSLKSGAKLKENVKRLNIDCIEDMVMLSRRKLSDAGYEPYYMYRQKYQAGGLENVGWAKRGKACVYNVDVMEEIADNLALGANAISKKLFDDGSRIERHATPKDLVTYISKVDSLIKERGELFGYFSGTRIGIYTKNHTKE